jgi:hypothetical protein
VSRGSESASRATRACHHHCRSRCSFAGMISKSYQKDQPCRRSEIQGGIHKSISWHHAWDDYLCVHCLWGEEAGHQPT